MDNLFIILDRAIQRDGVRDHNFFHAGGGDAIAGRSGEQTVRGKRENSSGYIHTWRQK